LRDTERWNGVFGTGNATVDCRHEYDQTPLEMFEERLVAESCYNVDEIKDSQNRK
jgi:hypothetical protein